MRVLALLVVAACSDTPSMEITPIGGACNGQLTIERDTSGEHVPMSTVIDWTNNPPTSGPHFDIWAAWDRQYTELPRGHWVHNAEHGGVVLLYNCDGPCPEVVDALLAVARDMPADSMCTAPVTKRVIVSSDPLLPAGVQVAAVAWNHAYTASCADDYLATFTSEHYAKAPENVCANGAALGGTAINP
jgi:Protein of unknown function (DUF3105)